MEEKYKILNKISKKLEVEKTLTELQNCILSKKKLMVEISIPPENTKKQEKTQKNKLFLTFEFCKKYRNSCCKIVWNLYC